MNIGISKEEIAKIFEENGVKDGERTSVDKIVYAIADVINKNNQQIEKNVANFVSKEFDKKLRTQY
ncbi:hypothetical protein [Cytobacillus praedii]|uniref:hypothetical protein n=1 Tax=Cytobacillus praedii TaxID=1742358 RepID=UPI002E21DE2C|nr:hypothetical protein [Cytobacillus praedii]